MRASVAIVSFLPDAGHVLPLIRIGAVFAERGYEVICYLPQECAGYVDGYNVRVVSLGPAIDDTTKIGYIKALGKLARRSVFYNAFSGATDLFSCYWRPLLSWAARQSAFVRRSLLEQQPLLLLGDSHLFGPLYADLSRDLRIPLILHSSEGTTRLDQTRYVQVYGIDGSSYRLQRSVEFLGCNHGEINPTYFSSDARIQFER